MCRNPLSRRIARGLHFCANKVYIIFRCWINRWKVINEWSFIYSYVIYFYQLFIVQLSWIVLFLLLMKPFFNYNFFSTYHYSNIYISLFYHIVSIQFIYLKSSFLFRIIFIPKTFSCDETTIKCLFSLILCD